MRILIYCPTYRCEEETRRAIDAICEHSHHQHGIQVFYDHENVQGVDERQAILWKYSRAQRIFRAWDADAMLIVEDDIIPPADTLEKLIAAGGDMAFGLYLFRRTNNPVLNASRYIHGSDQRWPDESLTLHPDTLKEVWGKVIRVSGLGLGCLLVHKHVMHGVNFRDGGNVHCDYSFGCDVLRAGYTIMCDTSVLCGHKCPDGRILWPANPAPGKPGENPPDNLGYTVTHGKPSTWHQP